MNQHECDVVVVGAGPAGSVAATLIALQGHRAILLEREAQPRYKIGESLLPSTVHGICPLLGVADEIKQAGFVSKKGGTFLWGKNPKPWTFAFAASAKFPGPTSYAYQVERIRFDAILLNNARKKGVEVRERHKVAGVLEGDGRVQGVRVIDAEGEEYAVRSKFVVDASGYSSMLASSVGERIYSRFFQNIAVFAYFNNGKRLPEPNSGNIFCCAFDKGWFWYIPLSPTLTSVGAVIGKEHSGLFGEGRESAYLRLIKECGPISDLLINATRVTDGTYGEVRVRKDFSYCNTKFWKPGLVLVGDAACFIDPVFSSGVHLATYSALLAARSINTCLSGTLAERDAFREFERRYLREYRIFYDFLTAFYDVDQDLDTYYWAARKVLNSAENGNEAFIQIVGGLGDTAEPAYKSSFDFLSSRDATKAGVFSAARGASDDMYVESHRRSTEGQKFLSELYREGAELQALATNPNFALRPVFEDGLVPSADGASWVSPT